MNETTITITHNPATGTTSIQAPGLPPLMALGLMDLAKGMLIAQMTAPQPKSTFRAPLGAHLKVPCGPEGPLAVPQLSIVGNVHRPQGA